MPSFMDARNLEPFIDKALADVINAIEFKTEKGQTVYGYKAVFLGPAIFVPTNIRPPLNTLFGETQIGWIRKLSGHVQDILRTCWRTLNYRNSPSPVDKGIK